MRTSSPRRRLFVHEYLVDKNATKAAERAGFSKKTAYSQGQRLLKNVEVKKAILEALERQEERTKITSDRVLEELAILGFSDLRNYMEINEDTGAIRAKGFEEMPENASRAIEFIQEDRIIRESADGKESNVVNDKIKFKLHDKIKALELIGKHLGLFPNKIEGDVNLKVALSIADLKKSMSEYKKNGS